VKRALIVGINTFQDNRLSPILGEDDARLVQREAEKAGYRSVTLLGREATKANIEAALDRMKRELGPRTAC
jgi:methylmalonyl-CoA mutase N-terminal domain/subunit